MEIVCPRVVVLDRYRREVLSLCVNGQRRWPSRWQAGSKEVALHVAEGNPFCLQVR